MKSYLQRRKYIIRHYLEGLFIAAFIAIILRIFVLSPFKIPSQSMEPSLTEGDFIIAYLLPYGIRLSETKKIGVPKIPKVNTVVLYRYLNERKSIYIKRVLGVPGDQFEIRGGVVLINGQQKGLFPESISKEPTIIPSDMVFLMADNPPKSDDSQYWSLVHRNLILGEALFTWLSVDSSTSHIRWHRIGSIR